LVSFVILGAWAAIKFRPMAGETAAP